jgi:hypothetical protein
MLRKRVIRTRYLQQKYDGGIHNRCQSSRAASWDKPLHDHDWCSIDDASAVVLMMKWRQLRPPPLTQYSWLHPWRPWWFDPLFCLIWIKTLCVCQENCRCFFALERYRVVKIACSCFKMVLWTTKNYKAHYILSSYIQHFCIREEQCYKGGELRAWNVR